MEADPDRVVDFLKAQPDAVVLWDAGSDLTSVTARVVEIGAVLRAFAKEQRVFAITDVPLQEVHALAGADFFSHHLLRRYDGPAGHVYTRVIHKLLSTDATAEFLKFFPDDIAYRK